MQDNIDCDYMCILDEITTTIRTDLKLRIESTYIIYFCTAGGREV
jgi:hypothetical protein